MTYGLLPPAWTVGAVWWHFCFKIYPVIAACFAAIVSPILLPIGILHMLGWYKLAKPLPLSPEVDTAMNDPRYGTHGYVEVNGVRFHYVEKGKKPGATLLLFLHGFPECWYSWRLQLEALSNDYHCVAVDMKGYGMSGKPFERSKYRIDVLVSDVTGLIDALGYKKAVVVGHDWGGRVAWHMAHMAADRLSALVIMNSPHPQAFRRNASLLQFLRMWYVFVFQVPWLPELLLSAFNWWTIGATFTTLHTRVRNRRHLSDTDVAVYKYSFSQPGGAHAVMQYFRNLWRRTPPFIENALAQPVSEQLPVLMLWGQHDGALGIELTRNMHRDVPNLELLVFPCSHWLEQDMPEEANLAVRAFLKKHDLAPKSAART